MLVKPAATLALAACLAPLQAAAQDAPAIATVEVAIRTLEGRAASGTDASGVAVGERVEICFTPSKDGFVTVWAKDLTSPAISLIYPNDYAEAGRRGVPVIGGEETCIGREGDGFVLRAQPPAGVTDVTVAWTAREDEQLTPEMFANPSAHAGVLAIGTSRFEIIE